MDAPHVSQNSIMIDVCAVYFLFAYLYAFGCARIVCCISLWCKFRVEICFRLIFCFVIAWWHCVSYVLPGSASHLSPYVKFSLSFVYFVCFPPGNRSIQWLSWVRAVLARKPRREGFERSQFPTNLLVNWWKINKSTIICITISYIKCSEACNIRTVSNVVRVSSAGNKAVD